ncbi:MAG: T9SS type A sorting domain-containing protein [Bacteroidota bacterium]|nr:T9SS type A sorting domain-containing protein [Bacteroidota bacterium]
MKKLITKLNLGVLVLITSISNSFATSYTSVTSGSYNNATTWSPVGVPTSDDNIIIATGHTVTLIANSLVKNINIQQGAVLDNDIFTLKINTTGMIQNPTYENNGIHNGTGNLITYNGYDLEMSGSGIINCPIEIDSYGLRIKNNCNLTINNNVFHSVPGNFGMNNKYFIDCSQGGRLTINGNIIIDPNYTVSILNALGTIIINGDVDFDGFAGSHIDNSDSLIIIGNLYLGANSGYFWNVPNGVALSTVASVRGDVFGGGSGQSFIFQEANAVIKFGGQVFPTSADGDLLVSGISLLTSFPVEPNTVEYNGTSPQIIKAPSDGATLGGAYTLNTYSILKINNTSPTGVSLLSTNIDVNDTLFLIDGVLNTGTNEIYVKNNATNSIINYSDTSYVNGNLRRNVAPAGGSYNFPIGNSTSYQLANTNLLGTHTVGNLLANFSNLTSGTGLPIIEGTNNFSTILNCGGISSGVGNINDGVWTITPDAGTANYDLTLNGKNYDNQTTINTIVKRANATASWFLSGNYIASSGSQPLITSRTGLSGFSQFAIASSNLPTALNNSIAANQFNIYPNPATINVIVNLNNPDYKNSKVELYDLIGNKLNARTNSNQNQLTIYRDDLAQGIYVIKITSSEKSYSQKIIFE